MKQVSKLTRPIKNIWRQEGTDFICDLTTMKRAVVVRLFTPVFNTPYYAIALASYFPFTEEHQAKKFDNPNDCIDYSEEIIISWIKSILSGVTINNQYFLGEEKK